MPQQLSEYEKQRLENIEYTITLPFDLYNNIVFLHFVLRKNKELLRQLNVPAVGSKHGLPSTKTTEKKKSTVQHKPKAVKKEKVLPVRSSARLRNIPADATTDADLKRSAEELLQLSEAKKPKRIAKLEDQDQADFLKILGDAKVDNVIIPNDGPPSDKVPKALQEEASNLEIRHIWPTIKVTPDRINFAA